MSIVYFFIFGLIIYAQIKIAARGGKPFFYFFCISIVLRLLLMILHQFDYIDIVDSGKDSKVFVSEYVRLCNEYTFFDLLQFWGVEGQYGNYPKLLGLICKVSGDQSGILAVIINFLLYGFSVIFLNNAARYIFRLKFNDKLIFYTILFTFPLPLFYSIIMLRESVIIFAVSASIYFYVHLRYTKSIPFSWLMLLSINILALVLHVGHSLFFLTVLGISLYEAVNARIINKTKLFLIISIPVALLFISHSGQYYGGYLEQFVLADSYSEKFTDKYQESRSDSLARYPKEYGDNLFINLVYAYPMDFMRFTFTPYVLPPTNVLGASLSRFFNSVYFTLIIAFSFLSFTKLNTTLRVILLLYFLSIPMYVLGSVDNFQSSRHKSKYFPLIVLLAPVLTGFKYTATVGRK